jgi:hypothetical protein
MAASLGVKEEGDSPRAFVHGLPARINTDQKKIFLSDP